ncbi:MAG: response regulator [Ktedonobacterales bacterium]|nr:response regulator [Ktedonobacterales bacterium]
MSVTHVLVVDDDDAIRDAVRFALEDAGYTVSEASNGLAALKQLRAATDRAVVLLDLMMPGLDGAGVLGAVAGDHRLASRHTYILVTANTKTLTLAFANLLTSLSVPILSKHFDVDVLLETVASAARRIG